MMVDTDADGPDSAPAEAASADREGADESTIESGAGERSGEKSRRLQLSVSIRSLVTAVVIAALVGSLGVLGWLYLGANRKLDDLSRQSENRAHAEGVALHYAVEAAAMNYEDLNAWKTKLVAGTSPELKEKLTKAATSMEQILVPLQWNSTARPLAAKVRSVVGGTYVVDSFVSVLTKTAQAPEPLQSTATYSVTIDSTKDWQITDVGGVGDALGEK